MPRAQSVGLTIREGRRADHDALVTLWSGIETLHARITPEFFRAPPTRAHAAASVTTALEQASGRYETLLVAERGGRVVGFVRVALFDTPRSPERVERRRARIEEVMVAEEERRHGVGRRLVEEARAWSRSRGAEQIVLTVWSGNADATRFYRSLGFVPVSQVLGRAP